jgi:hypothetical protein
MKTLSIVIAVLMCAMIAEAQTTLKKVKEVIASGATDATGTNGGVTYRLRGTIGQAVIGPVSAVNGGNHDTVWQGFWTPGMKATGIEIQNVGPAPIDFTLEQNYPNPYSATTMIGFALPNYAHVVLQVYSMTGMLVKTLVDDNVSPGKYNVTFDASELATGTYLYMLQSGGRLLTKRMVVIR